ncbi:MAG TPA: metallophosphoesterase [Bryobacteraceae bacterium]|nr:metallophosphoesterase [Bryobacteraceae bacterium]
MLIPCNYIIVVFRSIAKRSGVVFLTAACAAVLALVASPAPDSFHFVILGDRTGEAVPGVYQQILHEAAAENPSFVLSVGDTIQGTNDARAEEEWQEAERILQPFSRYPIYLTPGNHDIWSPLSEQLFRKYAGHPPHYSFDYRQAHFTILDNSRGDDLSAGELQFLETDLAAHTAQPVKFIVSHRPSWLLNAALGNSNFPLHQLAKKYGVQIVLAGHVHEMLHAELDGITYISAPSSGGHLRLSGKYEDGWFFGHILAEVRGRVVTLRVQEARAPHGQGRITRVDDWGITGLKAALVGPGFQPAAGLAPGAPRGSAAAARKGCLTGILEHALQDHSPHSERNRHPSLILRPGGGVAGE